MKKERKISEEQLSQISAGTRSLGGEDEVTTSNGRLIELEPGE